MIPQTALCVANRNTYEVRKLFCRYELSAAMSLKGQFLSMARRAKSGICKNSVLRARTAEKSHSLYGLQAVIRCDFIEWLLKGRKLAIGGRIDWTSRAP